MTIEITQPISTTDLRKLMAYQLPQPGEGERRYLVASFTWASEDSGWIVRSLSVHQPRLLALSGDRYRLLQLRLNDQLEDLTADKPFEDRQLGTALLTFRGKPKIYKTMDAFYRDMKAIAGNRSTVVFYEWSSDEDANHG